MKFSIEHSGGSQTSWITVEFEDGDRKQWFIEGFEHKKRACEIFKRLAQWDDLLRLTSPPPLHYKGSGQLDIEKTNARLDERQAVADRAHADAYHLYGGPHGTPIPKTEELLAQAKANGADLLSEEEKAKIRGF